MLRFQCTFQDAYILNLNFIQLSYFMFLLKMTKTDHGWCKSVKTEKFPRDTLNAWGTHSTPPNIWSFPHYSLSFGEK